MAYINFLISFVILRDVAAFSLEYFAPTYNTEFAFDKESLGIMLVLPLFLILLGTLVVRAVPRVTNVALNLKTFRRDSKTTLFGKSSPQEDLYRIQGM